MGNNEMLLKVYRNFSKEEAILLLKDEIASLNLEIGVLKSEKSENNWLSLQDTKEIRLCKALKEYKLNQTRKISKLEAIIRDLKKQRDVYLTKIYRNEI